MPQKTGTKSQDQDLIFVQMQMMGDDELWQQIIQQSNGSGSGLGPDAQIHFPFTKESET